MKRWVDGQEEKSSRPTRHSSALDEIHRIVPLGLTLAEARAWYVNRVLMPRLRAGSACCIFSFIILVSMLTVMGQVLEQNLTTHIMVHDFLLLVSGFLFASASNSIIGVTSQLSGAVSRIRNTLDRVCLGPRLSSVLTFGSAVSLIAFWYLPVHFNASVASASSAAEMCLSLVLAGSLIFVGARVLSRRLKLIALVIVGKVLGLYGMFLLLTPQNVYSFYSNYEQGYAGAALLFLMLALDFTIMPLWLYDYFRKTPATNVVNDSMLMA